MTEIAENPNRTMIEHVRRVNKLLSLYVFALQEKTALTAEEHNVLAQALHGLAEIVEQEGRRSPEDLPANRRVIEPRVIDGSSSETRP